MAKFIRDDLSVVYGDKRFDIPLKGEKVAIFGDSGTGKSYYWQILCKYRAIGALPDVICANYSTYKSGLLKSLLLTEKDKVFVIDNADLLIDSVDMVLALGETKNQLVLFGRHTDFFGIPRNCRARMINEGTHFYLDYLES